MKEPRGTQRFDIDVDDASSDDEGLNIVSHTMDDQFTHDNIGEVTTQVESNVSPVSALRRSCEAFLFLDQEDSARATRKLCPSGQDEMHNSWPIEINSLVKYAVFKNDLSLLDFLLKTDHECASNSSDKDKIAIGQHEFQLAIILGHIDCLVKLIQFGAIGLPLAKMSEHSGVEARNEPRYYPGLSIRGKKRSDWANAGRTEQKATPDGRPPLLISAMQGSLTSTEWFLGTAPGRNYLEYVNSHTDDDNVKRLAQSSLGLEGSILDWLQTRSKSEDIPRNSALISPNHVHLVLHCAVMSKPCDESERLVRYLVDHHPECLEVRSSGGHTPLALACSLHRVSFACILIAGGANQAVRDSQGNNLLHLLLVSVQHQTCRKPDEVTQMVDLLDRPLVSAMLVERAGDGSRTPFARWLHSCPDFSERYNNVKSDVDTTASMTALLMDLAESTNQKHLELLDRSGNTPVHEAVKKGLAQVLELMLDRRPDLLYRENATGSTPLEMAVDAWINDTTRQAPRRPLDYNNDSPLWQNAVSRDPSFFVKGKNLRSMQETMLQVCRKWAQQQPRKRRLVSLFEANEVAKRLTARKVVSEDDKENYYRVSQPSVELDEVALWGAMASEW